MLSKIALSAVLIISCTLPFLYTQETPPIVIRPRPSEEIILAVADAQPASADKAGGLTETLKTFNQVLWDDVSFSGFFTVAGKSYYPPRPVRPGDVNYDEWNVLPTKVGYLSAGAFNVNGTSVHADLCIYDMKQRRMIFGTSYDAGADQVRAIAHRWADEVVYQLTAGASRGIASTKIAYVSRKGNAKEICTMDYDGYNQLAFTHSGSLNLFPSWAPDNSKLAFTSVRSMKWEISIYSFIDGSRLHFPEFNSFASTPAISPDGTEVAFSLRTPRGDTDLYVSKLDGSNRRDITNNPAIDNAPTWSPSGKQLAFESDREGGVAQIYICDSDGANVRRIIKEGGDADSPAWSPDGRWIAFHWKPHLSTRYDIFLAEVSTGKIRQVTYNSGSNESPSWAPDSRHIVFQSNRSGTNQIYIKLLDDSEPRMITNQGNNTSPVWSAYFRNKTEH
jgi:TolB protein